MLKVNHIITSAILSAFLVGCSSDGGGSSSNLTGTTVEITSETEAVNTLASISAVQSLSSTTLGSLAPSKSSKKLSPSFNSPSLVTINFTNACSFGGTFSVSGDEQSDGSFSGSISYSNCNEGILMNGSMSLSGIGTYNDPIETWNDTLSTSNFSMVSDYFTMTMNMNIIDIGSYNYSTAESNYDTTLNGTMSVTETSSTSQIGYDNFHTVEQNDGIGYLTTSINGKMSVDSDLTPCANGIYEFQTISPLTSYSGGGFTGGSIKVNGATFSFNADGTADITYADGNTTTGVVPSSTVSCN